MSSLEHLSSILPHEIFADLPGAKPVNQIFTSLRPDIVAVLNNQVFTIELTVCHESNFEAAKIRKNDRYKNLHLDLSQNYVNHKLYKFTLEISVLGLISDTSQIIKALGCCKLPLSLLNACTKTAIECSRDIFCARNDCV